MLMRRLVHAIRHALLLLAALAVVNAAKADLLPANGAERAANFAEISIFDDRIEIALEIDFRDIRAFAEPAPPGQDPAAGLSNRMGRTIRIEADGVTLRPEVRLVELRQRKERSVPGRLTNNGSAPVEELDPNVIHVGLEYRFDGKPDMFRFIPPLADDGIPLATLGFILMHDGVPVIDYRYLSQSEDFRPDWNDPWYSRFDNPNLSRHHKSALMSFLAVEPRELRHEMILRLRDLEDWTDLGLGHTEVISAENMKLIEQGAIDFLRKHNPVVADGEGLTPDNISIWRLSTGVNGVQIIASDAPTDRNTTLVGAVLSYPVKALPNNLQMTWELFTDDARTIPVQVLDSAGGVPDRATPEYPVIEWTNFIVDWKEPHTFVVQGHLNPPFPLPLLSIILVVAGCGLWFAAGQRRLLGVPARFLASGSVCLLALLALPLKTDIPVPGLAMDDSEGEPIARALIDNMSVAMQEVTEGGYLDALSPFVVAANREPVGAELRRGLAVMLPSGARARVDEIVEARITERRETGGDAQQWLVEWIANVSGGHWGHMHLRQVHYRALMDLRDVDDRIMLDDLTVLQARILSEPMTLAAMEPLAAVEPK